ncbi:MAG: hypothetical protein R2883_00240 [Caldisericia bacterium]
MMDLQCHPLDYLDDLVFTRFEFPADPGRAGGGTIDDNYIISENVETAHSNAIGGARYKVVEITPENPVEHNTYSHTEVQYRKTDPVIHSELKSSLKEAEFHIQFQ